MICEAAMFKILTERLHQRFRTVPYPAKAPALPPRFRGRPVLHGVPQPVMDGLAAAARSACPTGAFSLEADGPRLDMGLCVFCGACAKAAPDLVTFDGGHKMAGLSREELLVRPGTHNGEACPPATPDALRKLFRRSLRIRQVSAAGCNACEADCNVLTTVVFDLARFGIDFVASPRHADAVLVTGPVPRNMHLALRKCYDAMPGPKIVIAVGACAISGGLFKDMDQESAGTTPHLSVDLFIPGCPPNPYTILDGLLRFLDRDT